MGKTTYYQSVPAKPKPAQQPEPPIPAPANKLRPSNIEPILDATPETPTPNKPGCVCNREVVAIVCSDCGFYRRGLKRNIVCPIHPKVKFLLDLQKCPKCKGTELEEDDFSGDMDVDL